MGRLNTRVTLPHTISGEASSSSFAMTNNLDLRVLDYFIFSSMRNYEITAVL